MADQRIVKLAQIMTEHSLTIKKGDIIKINSGIEAKPLILECVKNILKKGAFPRVDIDLPGYSYTYYSNASKDQLTAKPIVSLYEAQHTAGIITIGCENNTKELSNIDPQKMALRRKTTRKISDILIKKDNWLYFEYPTESLAQDAEMSLQEFEDFIFDSCIKDWKKEEERQDSLKKLLDKSNNVRIIGKDTDLSFSIKGRQGLKCFGKHNLPDGEVYIAPVEATVNGYIFYSFPAIHGGREVSGIRLEFVNGKVVKATADKNEEYLKKLIAVDKGASYIGEFGIGLNYDIKKFMRQILFDEKMGGTIHLALGMAYPKGGGRNKSALHWDMIKDLRQGGEIWLDNKLIQKDGKFLIKL